MNEDISGQAEAVYYSALALLDELPSHEQRKIVVMNWVKYVLVLQAQEMVGEHPSELMPVFSALCSLFVMQVLRLPHKFASELEEGLTPCGLCPECIAAGIEPPVSERPTEPAPKDETIN